MSYSGMLVILWQMLRNIATPVWAGGVSRSYRQAASFINQEKLTRVKQLAEQGIVKPYIGGIWSMDDALEVCITQATRTLTYSNLSAQAYEILMSGHAKGKLVIKVA
jgi:hypothetical protein